MPEYMTVYAYNDKVGVVCSDDCGADVMTDINNDNDNADAGCEPGATEQAIATSGGICMGCGKVLT